MKNRRAVLTGMALAGGLTVLCLAFLVRPLRVDGQSMEPTLQRGDLVLAWIGPGLAGAARTGRIVVARVPAANGIGFDRVVKRVARVEGISDGRRWTLVGDNPAASRDSRDYGAIDASRLDGVIWFRLRPRPGRL